MQETINERDPQKSLQRSSGESGRSESEAIASEGEKAAGVDRLSNDYEKLLMTCTFTLESQRDNPSFINKERVFFLCRTMHTVVGSLPRFKRSLFYLPFVMFPPF